MEGDRLRMSGSMQDALARIEVDAVGVASVADMSEGWLQDQILALLPGARSAIALAMEVFPEVLDFSHPEKLMGEASTGDMLAPHMDHLNGRLTTAAYDLATVSRRAGFKALPLPAAAVPTDSRYLTAVLSYKHVAQAAGLGSIGRHSLLVTPDFGPRVRLACLLTEAEFRPTPRLADGLCDDCNECIAGCPAHALKEPQDGELYSINKFACNAFRGGSGSCSECMRLCPSGR